MNAPHHPTPALTDARARVEKHLPGCFGDQLETRARLLDAADTASAAMWKCASDDEAHMLGEIVRLGQFHAYATYPTEALQALARALHRMGQAAGELGKFAEMVGGGE